MIGLQIHLKVAMPRGLMKGSKSRIILKLRERIPNNTSSHTPVGD
ncbi:hypothetical protein [Wolbachia endosymbiont of Diaphorina citri]|nr:hypothetical protein [Wolbachia endosymbiont of Diaphorina citri]